MVQDRHGNQLGIDFKADGTFDVGGWNAEGEWVVLRLAEECKSPHCKVPGSHGRDFPLDQYTSAEQESSGS